jgi:hypothetical protein
MMLLNAVLLEMDEQSPCLWGSLLDSGGVMINGGPEGGNPSTRIIRCTW